MARACLTLLCASALLNSFACSQIPGSTGSESSAQMTRDQRKAQMLAPTLGLVSEMAISEEAKADITEGLRNIPSAPTDQAQADEILKTLAELLVRHNHKQEAPAAILDVARRMGTISLDGTSSSALMASSFATLETLGFSEVEIIESYLELLGSTYTDSPEKIASVFSEDELQGFSPEARAAVEKRLLDSLEQAPGATTPSKQSAGGNSAETQKAPSITGLNAIDVDLGTRGEAVPFQIIGRDSSLNCTGSLAVKSSNTAILAPRDVTFSGSAPNCALAFNRELKIPGSIVLTITLSDGKQTTDASIGVSIFKAERGENAPPTIGKIYDVEINEDGVLAAVPVTIDDPDSSLSCQDALGTVVQYEWLIPANGIRVSGLSPNCSLRVQPKENQYGTTKITVSVTDGNSIALQDFFLHVLPVNDPPSISQAGDLTKLGAQDTPLPLALSRGVDPDGATGAQTLVYEVVTPPTHGQLGTWPADAGQGGSIIYTPDPLYNGGDSFSYRICDTNAEPLCTSAINVGLSIANTNDAPTDLLLTNTSIDENVPTGTLVGLLSTIDPDPFDTFSYSLESVLDHPDNAAFSINNNQLRMAISPNFEDKSEYALWLRVRDLGGNGFSHSKEFTITVNDRNDPPSPPSLDNLEVPENRGSNLLVGQLSTTDEDPADTFVYRLAAGLGSDHNDLFEIAGTELRVKDPLDYEIDTSLNVRVEVQDQNGNGLKASQTFTINVTDENDPPTALSLTGNTVSENASLGHTIGTFATDDVDSADTHTYALTANPTYTDNGSFTISNNELLLSTALDFEDKDKYSIEVSSTDPSGQSVTAVFTISVTNENEAPTISAINDQIVLEDGVVSGIPFTIADEDSPVTCEKSVTGVATEDNILSVAQITISGPAQSCLLDLTPVANENGETSVTLTVTDGALTATQTFKLTVTPVNDTPAISNPGNTSKFVQEDVGGNVLLATAADPDVATDEQTLFYRLLTPPSHGSLPGNPSASTVLSGNPLSSFSLYYTPSDGYTGADSFAYEICDSHTPEACVGPRIVNLTIDDVAEEPTDITLTNNRINENNLAGAAIGTLDAVDNDIGDTFTFTLASGAGSEDNSSFQINGNTVEIVGVADFEFKSTYFIRIQAEDSATLTTQKQFVINIDDLNERPTDIAISPDSLLESPTPSTTIGTLSSVDEDGGESFTYALVAGDGDTDNSLFSISGTQILVINEATDFETKPSYSIRVETTDKNGAGLKYEKALTISVTDANEAPTAITLDSNELDENSGPNALVGNLSAVDEDAGDEFIYSLVSGFGDNVAFNILGNALRKTQDANHEGQDSYSLRIRVIDKNGAGQDFQEDFTVNIVDLNERPTEIKLSNNTVTENVPDGTTIGILSAVDEDESDSSEFTLVPGDGSDDNGIFAITGNNLSINSSPDYDTKSSYTIRVEAWDKAGTGLQYEQVLTIQILNENEAPVISDVQDQTSAEDTAVQNIPVTITDVDSTLTCATSLSAATTNSVLLPLSNIAFSGSAPDCLLRLTPMPNQNGSATVTLAVTDSGLLTDVDTLNYTVNAVNDSPSIVSARASSKVLTQDVPGFVALATGADPDIATNSQTLAYIVTQNPLSGTLSAIPSNPVLGGNLTYTPDPGYTGSDSFTYQICDSFSPPACTQSIPVEITVADANDAPTALTLSDLSIDENLGPNAVVGSFETSDVDIGEVFEYTLETHASGPDNAFFNIVGNTLRITANPNFEDKSSYDIYVRSTDSGGLFIEQTFNVTINDVNEAPTGIALSNNAIDENAGAGQTVGTLTVADDDAGDVSVLSLVSGAGATDNALFTIDGSKNLILGPNPNYEAKQSYSVRVEAKDQSGSGLTRTEIFVINVGDLNEIPTSITLSKSTLAENTGDGALIGSFSTTDPDFNESFVYNFFSDVGGEDNSDFTITGNNLRINSNADYESQDSYNILVEVTDKNGFGLSIKKAFVITITNENEAPTDITLSQTSVDENTTANVLVGTLSVSDLDVSDVQVFTLVNGSGDTDNSAFNIPPGTNELRLNSPANFEGKSSYSVRVQTQDQSGLGNIFQKALVVSVNDVNETPTDITLSNLTVAENAGANATVGFLGASDVDAVESFTFGFVAGADSDDNGAFNIQANELRLTASADREIQATYTVRLGVYDKGNFTTEKSFTISVTNINEAPTISDVTDKDTDEDTQLSAVAVTIDDVDSALNCSISLGAISSNTGLLPNSSILFSGTPPTCLMSFSPAPNQNGVTTITLTVSDGVLDATDTFDLTVNPVNDDPTLVTTGTTSKLVTQDIATTIQLSTGDDVDIVTDSQSLSYSVTTQPSHGTLSLIPEVATIGGTLLYTPSSGYAGSDSFTYQICDDHSTPACTAGTSVSLTIADINDGPTDIVLDNLSVEENAGPSATVGILSAVDPDTNDTFTFTLVGGPGDTDNESFEIAGTSLRLKASADYETKALYAIRISAMDSGSLTTEKQFSISILDVNDPPTDITLSATAVLENEPPNTVVASLGAIDQDDGDTFTFSLHDGADPLDNASFDVTGSTLTLIPTADRETANAYSLMLRATDLQGAVFDKVVTIDVVNVNEAPSLAVIDPQSTDEDVDLTGVSISIADVDSALACSTSLTASSSDEIMLPSGNISFSGTAPACLLSAVPTPNQNGLATVTVTVSDGALPNSRSFDLTVDPINDAPTLATTGDVNVILSQDTPQDLNLATGADPDVDTDGQSLVFFPLTLPDHGDLGSYPGDASTPGVVQYSPDPGFVGADSFSYRICDSFSPAECTSNITVSVTVSDLNDPPTDLILSNASVNENAGPNAIVGTLSTNDPDALDTFTYSFGIGIGDDDNAAFNLAAGGVLRLTSSADFETKDSYSVRIQVTDSGGATYSESFTISINDTNDAPTDITITPASLAENAGENALVGTLAAVDPDASPDTFSFEFVSGQGSTDNDAFTIAGTSLLKKTDADVETKASYSIRVRTKDLGGSGLPFERNLAITINDVNEVPSAIQLSATSAPESTPDGGLVAILSAIDVDGGDTHIFAFATGNGTDDADNGAFTIANTNELRITTSPVLVIKDSYKIRLSTQDSGGLLHSQAFTITVTNTNDAPTLSDVSDRSTNEDTPLSGVSITIEDDDHALDCLTSLSATSSNTSLLPLANISFSGTAPSCSVTLTPKANQNGTTTVTLTVTDGGGLSDQDTFVLTVNPVNDDPSVVSTGPDTLAATQNAPSSLTLSIGIDPDIATNSQTLDYHISTNPSHGSISNIAPDGTVGGTLTYTPTAAYSGIDSFSYMICDSYSPAACTDPLTVTVTVSNTNDAPTDINLTAQSIDENSAAGSTIGTLSTEDLDVGDVFTYTLVSGAGSADNSAFTIAGDSLRIRASPNHELQDTYHVRIQSQDSAGQSTQKEFTITINDLNENPTDIMLSSTSLDENLLAGSVVGTVTGLDPDVGNTLTFTLVSGIGSNDNSDFNLNAGTLTFNEIADHETKVTYSIRIRAEDALSLRYEEVFTITINDINEPPSISNVNDTTQNEDTSLSGIAFTIDDVDSTLTCLNSVSAASSNPSVLPLSGIAIAGTAPNCTVTLLPAPNQNGSSTITLTVSDGALPVNETFLATVDPVNDAPAIATTGSRHRTLAQDSSVIVTLDTASDPDIATNEQSLDYEVTAGPNHGSLGVFPASASSGGTVTYTGNTGYVGSDSFSYRICDTYTSAACTTAVTVNFNITNTNESPTDINLSNLSVPENSGSGTVVGNLSAIDPDVGESFTFTLVAGTGDADNGSFDIVGNTLRMTTSANFESKSTYSVLIRATDSGNLNFEEAFSINITNVNEQPTNITLSPSSVNENVGASFTVGTLSTSDPDSGDTYTYTLVGGTGGADNGSFSISADSLVLTPDPNFESKSTYSLRVQSEDSGGLTTQKALTVSVNDVNEAPTDIFLSKTTIEENAGSNALVATVTAADVDAGDSMTFDLVSGAGSDDNNAFTVSGTSLLLNNSADYETKSSYSVRLQATDSGALAVSKVFVISIIDTNEPPTISPVSDQSTSEDSTLTAVTFTISDLDSSLNCVTDLSASTDNAPLMPVSRITFAGTAPNCTASFSPSPNQNGVANVTLTVTDGALTAQSTFELTVTPVNDNPTVLTQGDTSKVVSQDGSATVTLATATDPDILTNGQTLTYEVMAAPSHGLLSGWTAGPVPGGTVLYSPSAGYVGADSFTYRICDTEDSPLCTSNLTVNFAISDVNDPPTGVNLSNLSINENLGPNALVGTLSAVDPDATDSFTYSLVTGAGSADNAAFTIAGAALRKNTSPDFEAQSSFSVRIRVTDSSGQTTEDSFTITVNDLNEAPTSIILSNNSVPENAGANAPVGVLSASDPDAAQTHGFSFTTGDGDTDNALFTINAAALSLNPSADFETKSAYSIRLRVQDQGGLTYDQALSIVVTNVNETPVISDVSDQSTNEDEILSGVAVNITDVDSALTCSGSLSAASNNPALMPVSGIAFSGTSPTCFVSFNPTADANGQATITFTLDDGGLSVQDAFLLTVSAVNDDPSLATLGDSVTVINEDSSGPVSLATGSDPDVTTNGQSLSYFLSTPPANGTVTGFLADAVVGASATYTPTPGYTGNDTFAYQICDASAACTAAIIVNVTVTDANEAPADIALSSTSIAENAGTNAQIGLLSATDPDPSETFSYALVAGSGDADNLSFNIAGSSLRLNSSADFEMKNSYAVRIQVTDSGGASFEEEFTITVTDENDAPTDINLTPAVIAENEAIGTVVGSFTATDQDALDTSTFSFVTGEGDDDNGAFTIDAGVLKLTAVPDYETKALYSVRVQARDQGGTGATYQEIISVAISNVNENPTSLSLSSSAVAEGASIGSFVATLSATDPDAGATFTYSKVAGLGDGDNALFTVSSNTLTIDEIPNFVAKPTYSTRLKVTDQGGLSFEQAFTINVLDANDPPTISDVANQTTDEDVTLSNLPVTIGDPDGALRCDTALTGSSSNSSIIPGSNISFGGSYPNCTVTIVPAQNQNGSATITLTVSDGSLSAQDSFTVTVNPVDDDPVIVLQGATSAPVSQNGSTTISAATGTDVDIATNLDALSYAITTLPSHGSLALIPIDASVGGTFTYSPNLNYAGTDSFTYAICDTSSPALCTASTTVAVTVSNVNDSPTDIILSNNTLAENLPPNTTVGTLSAVDPDGTGETFTYSLVAGPGDTDNSSFALSGNNLILKPSPNFETKASYSLLLQVRDAGGLTYQEAFTVTITNVNEAPTSLNLSDVDHPENAGPDSLVATLSAVDPDASESFTYSFATGAGDSDNGAFMIVNDELRMVANANFEAKNSFRIRLRVTDQGGSGLTFESQRIISITNVNEQPADLILNPSTVAENVASGTIIGTLSTLDPDLADSHVYDFINGAGDTDNEKFTISGGNNLVLNESPNYENQSSYSLLVRSRDQSGAGLTVTKILTVAVTNGNEAPEIGSIVDQSTLEDTPIENLTVTITDPDTALNCSTSLSVTSDNTSLLDLGDWSLSGTPPACVMTISPKTNLFGVATLTLTVTDGSLQSQESFAVTVSAVNDQPTIVSSGDDTKVLDEDTSALILLDEGSDVDIATNGQLLTYDISTPPQHGSTSGVPGSAITGGSLTYTPDSNFNGADSFAYRICDNGTPQKCTADRTVTVTVNAVNDAPTDITLSNSSVLENGPNDLLVGFLSAVDPDAGDSFTFALASGGTHNALFTLTGNVLRINSPANFESTPLLSIRVSAIDQNGFGLNFETDLTISVVDLNDPPTLAAISDQAINEDSSLSNLMLTLNDEDGSLNCLSALTLDSSDTSKLPNGNITFGGTYPNCTVSLTPASNKNGAISVHIVASDGTDSTSRTFTLTVNPINDAPTIVDPGDTLLTLDANSPRAVELTTAADPDTSTNNQILSYQVTSTPSNGSLGVYPQDPTSGGTLAYTPNTHFTGSDSFSYRICDNAGVPLCTGITSVSVTVTGWAPKAYIKAANAEAGDHFGESVSLSDDTLAVSADAESSSQSTITNGTAASSNNSVASAGAVYVYRRSGSSWAQEAYIKAANAGADDNFGKHVSLSGLTLAVGSPFEDSNLTGITDGTTASADNSSADSGAVYIYSRSGTNWAQEAYIKAANAGAGDNFGEEFSLSSDTLAVGTPFEDSNLTTITNNTSASADNSSEDSGAVYVYTRSGTSWSQQAYIKAKNANTGDQFGRRVSVSGDTLAVAADWEDSNQSTISNTTSASDDNSASNSGAVYIYRRIGTNWAQEAYIKAAHPGIDDTFGESVSLSGDTLAVGADEEDSNQTFISNGSIPTDDNSALDAGVVFVYRRSATSWAQEAYIKAANAAASDNFGKHVSLSGNTLAVGAPGEDSSQTTITHGGVSSSNNSVSNAGAVYVFKRTGATWTQDATIKAVNVGAEDNFGRQLSLSGDTLAVGTPFEDSNQTTITNSTTASSNNSSTDSGAVYVYSNKGRIFDPDIRVTARTTSSITFAWEADNLGSGDRVVVAPAAAGTGTPAVSCADGGSVTLSAGVNSYTYSGLSSGTKYGFRFCASDGATTSEGGLVWAETSP